MFWSIHRRRVVKLPGDPVEDTPYSRHVLALLETHDAIVPEIWAFEIANSVFVSFQKRRRDF